MLTLIKFGEPSRLLGFYPDFSGEIRVSELGSSLLNDINLIGQTLQRLLTGYVRRRGGPGSFAGASDLLEYADPALSTGIHCGGPVGQLLLRVANAAGSRPGAGARIGGYG